MRSRCRTGEDENIFHVNHFSRWKEQTCQVNAVIEEGEGIEKYQWTTTCGEEIQFGQQLKEDKTE